MFQVYKYKLTVNLADAAATADVNVATGINAGGPYAEAISAIDAAGAITAIAVGIGVAPIPTVPAKFAQSIIQNVYDITFINAVVVAQNHVYKLPHNILNLSQDEVVEAVMVPNIWDPVTGDLYPVTDRFFYKYDFSLKALYFGYPHADRAAYAAKGLKLVLNYKPAVD
jgi:hypothetical protein